MQEEIFTNLAIFLLEEIFNIAEPVIYLINSLYSPDIINQGR